jgi:hypothetical protein
MLGKNELICPIRDFCEHPVENYQIVISRHIRGEKKNWVLESFQRIIRNEFFQITQILENLGQNEDYSSLQNKHFTRISPSELYLFLAFLIKNEDFIILIFIFMSRHLLNGFNKPINFCESL